MGIRLRNRQQTIGKSVIQIRDNDDPIVKIVPFENHDRSECIVCWAICLAYRQRQQPIKQKMTLIHKSYFFFLINSSANNFIISTEPHNTLLQIG